MGTKKKKGQKAKPAESQPNTVDDLSNGDKADTNGENGSDESGVDQAEPQGESRGAMVQRHKREVKDWRKTVDQRIAKIPKYEKENRAQFHALVAKEEEELKQRHFQELQEHDKANQSEGPVTTASSTSKPSNGSNNGNTQENETTAAPGGLYKLNDDSTKKKGRQQRRREKKKKEEQEQRLQIEIDSSQVESLRNQEINSLEKTLKPLGFCIKEIAADGNCLYNALCAQLKIYDRNYDWKTLRKMAADYIRQNEEDFLPFMITQSEEEFAQVCFRIEHTTDWGGQFELTALSKLLETEIVIYSSSAPNVVMGEEYSANGQTLRLSYHKHYYTLGEHYNSIHPIEPL